MLRLVQFISIISNVITLTDVGNVYVQRQMKQMHPFNYKFYNWHQCKVIIIQSWMIELGAISWRRRLLPFPTSFNSFIQCNNCHGSNMNEKWFVACQMLAHEYMLPHDRSVKRTSWRGRSENRLWGIIAWWTCQETWKTSRLENNEPFH